MGGGKEGLEYGTLHNHMQLQGIVDVIRVAEQPKAVGALSCKWLP